MDENKKEIKEKNKFITVFKTLFIIGVLLLIYVRFIGTLGIQVKEYKIENNQIPDSLNGSKIVHLTDIHYGTIVNKNKLDKIVNEINSLKPDLVIFTGDLYDETIMVTDNIKEEIISSLKNIKSKLGNYAVDGNHDYSDSSFKEIITKSNFIYLENESKLIYNEDNIPFEIIGYKDARESTPDYNIELSNNYKIALIHEPDEVENIKNKNINLVFAGHSHGGQIRLPYIGALMGVKGAKKYKNDYYEINKNTTMYVSYGLGTSLFKIRYFNHPSINLYRLYKK